MTRIEDLVRQALDTPPATPATSDPLAALDRRIHRARVRLAVGAGVAVAAVAAAVVVPLSTVGGDRASKVEIANPPTPTASAMPGMQEVEPLWTNGATWVSGAGGQAPWFLATDPDGTQYVGQVGSPGSPAGKNPTPSPADRVVAGDRSVWLTRSTDTGFTTLTAFDPLKPSVMVSRQFDGETLTSAAVQGDSLYAVADKNGSAVVERFRLSSGSQPIERVSTTDLPQDGEIAATEDGHLWVHAGVKLIELVPTSDGVGVGMKVEWGTGPILSSTGRAKSELWAYDGRVIALSPQMLQGCLSCAEGERVFVAGTPGAALTAAEGGLYVTVVEPGTDGWDGHNEIGLYYYSPGSLRDGDTPITAVLPNVRVTSMASDLNGGVDYVDDQGTLNRWDPTGGNG